MFGAANVAMMAMIHRAISVSSRVNPGAESRTAGRLAAGPAADAAFPPVDIPVDLDNPSDVAGAALRILHTSIVGS